MDQKYGVAVFDYQNLDFGAKRKVRRGFVDLREISKAADEVARALIQERVLFVSDVYWEGLFDFKKRYLLAEMLDTGFRMEIVPVVSALRNSQKRLIPRHLIKQGEGRKLEDPVDLAIIAYCEARRNYVSALVVASSDGGFAPLVKSFGGFVVYYENPSRELIKVARGSIQARPGHGRRRLW